MWPWPHGEAMRSDARRAYFDRFRRDWRDFHDAMTRNVPAIEEDEARLMGKVDTSKWETPTMRVQADEWTIEMAVWTDEVSVWNYVDPSVDLWTRSSDLTSLEADKEEDECATGLLSMNDRELNGQERECAPKERVEVAVMKLDDQNVRTSCHVAQNDLTDDLPDAEQLSLHSHDADRKDACERTPDSPEVVTQPSSGSQDTLNRLTQHTQGAGVNGGSCLRELDLPHLQDPLCAKMGNSICEQAEEHLQVLFARFDELADLKSLLDEPSDLSHIFSATEQEGKSEINESLPSQQVIMPPSSQDGRHEELNDIRIRRVPFTGILRTRRPESVSKESVQVFKSVLRRNAAFTLMNTVPDNLDTQVSDMFRRAISSNGDFTKSETDTISDVRLAMLPSQITLADAARVERAHDHIKREAERVLQSIPPLPESLTSLSINMPSIWNVSWVREVYEEYVHDSLAPLEIPEVLNDDEAEQECVVSCRRLDEKIAEASSSNQFVAITSEAIMNRPKDMNQGAVRDELTSRRVRFRTDVSEPSTDELIAKFLCQETSSALEATTCVGHDTPGHDTPDQTPGQSSLKALIDHLARPALWTMAQKRLLRVDSSLLTVVMKSVSLDVVESIILQLHSKLKRVSENPSTSTHKEIIDLCASFRQAIWLHVLMLVMTCDDKGEATPDKESTTIRVISSLKYRAALGSAHYSEFLRVHVACGGSPPTAGANTGNDKHDFIDGSLTAGRSIKKQKRSINEPILRAVRIISSPRLLEKDDLLDELCSEYAVSFVERDLQAPIDLLIDERNGVCIIDEETFTNENSMREATFSLAKLQVQFEAIWILVAFDTSAKHEDLLHAFYPALTNFRINVTTYTCPSIQDICRCIREIVEACAESALATHRTLPRMWFERPFLLDDESQLERFLASTKIVNNVAAQSLLHRLSLEDLMTKSFEELRIMAQGSVSSLQLELLYSLMQSRHGIGHCVDQMDQN